MECVIVILCLYLWFLLGAVSVWVTGLTGSPYSNAGVFVRSLALPVLFPFYLAQTALKRR